jgi:hypothetical protein
MSALANAARLPRNINVEGKPPQALAPSHDALQ